MGCALRFSSRSSVKQYSVSIWIGHFNNSIAASPPVAMGTFLGIRSATWYLLVFGLNMDICPIAPFGAEWAMGYLAMRLSGKLRQPLNVAIAALLIKAFPILGTMKASALMGVLNPTPQATTIKDKPPTAFELKVARFQGWITGPIDKFGFAYYIASKMSIAIVIIGTATSIKYGVDIQQYLNGWGISETVQAGAGSLAGATLINLINLPVHLYVLPGLLSNIHLYGRKWKHLYSKSA